MKKCYIDIGAEMLISGVENTVSCITYTRKNLGLIIVDDNRLIRLTYIWFNAWRTADCLAICSDTVTKILNITHWCSMYDCL